MLKRITSKIDALENKKVIFIFLLIWLIINLVQAYFTELHSDEAYYWMYSRNLEWGYFDHPPMIALLIKIGYTLMPNELGVRLFPVLLGTATIWLVYKMIESQINKISLFIIIIGSVLIVQTHVGGFLAIPDNPVLFFAALFFYIYKKYLERDTVLIAFLLGTVGAAMLYSKYHGILVLFFTLLSNFKILKRRTFWLIPAVIILLLIPHVYWQVVNNFPTLEYHLISRSSSYKIDHTINYLYSQLLIAGPLSGIILMFFSFRYKGQNGFLKALKYNFAGFLLFFLLMSFKGHVEPHWTAIAYIPLIVLSYLAIENKEKVIKWLRILFVPTLILILFARVCLIVEILPRTLDISKEFHQWDKWAEEIKSKAKDNDVVFVNSFQKPSKYAFYTKGDLTTSLNNLRYRKNQFDLWSYTDSLQGRDIILMHSYYPDDTLDIIGMKYPVKYIKKFRSYYDVPVIVEGIPGIINSLDSVPVNIGIVNQKKEPLKLISSDEREGVWLCFTAYIGKKFKKQYLKKITGSINTNDTLFFETKIETPSQNGNYTGYFSIVNDSLEPSFNAKPVKFIINNQ